MYKIAMHNILLKKEVIMTKRLEMYRCEICGNLVEVILEGEGELVCCGQPMTLVKGKNKDDEGLEKHVPVFEIKENGGLEVRVGSILHPMNDDHYIMFIETISEDRNTANLQYLKPGMEPKMILEKKLGKTTAREFCNLHGLWEGESD